MLAPNPTFQLPNGRATARPPVVAKPLPRLEMGNEKKSFPM